MKLRHFYVSVCLMLISILNIHAQTSVTLTEAGTLASKLPADLNTVSDLTISGPLNGTDILTIRAMAGNLKVLNLKEASIVEDKVNSYRGTGNNANYTQNNVIGDYMFYGMTALTKVVLPKNVWSIGTWSNDNPWNGENTQVEGSPKTSYASSADDTSYPGCASFARCVNLTVVEFPSTLLYIGPKAFSYCIKLPSIAIPEGVEAMGSYTFNQCKELTTASIPSTVGVGKKLTWYYIKDGGRYQNEPNYFGYTFKGCNKLSNVSLANNLKQLSPYMFQGCTALTQISLPNTLARLNGAFEQCSGLTALQFPEGLQNIGSLSGCSSLKTLTMPNGITELGSLSECTSLTSITLPNKINTIPNYVFQNCTSLASISIPNTVSEITYHAFDGCTSLSKITLSTELNSIGGYAFAGCSALTEITLPNKLITIGEYAFTGSALKNIKLPQSLTEIGQYAFRNCTQLVTINFPPNVTDIKSYTFQNCEKLANITLPSGLMTIQNYAFDGCKSLGKVTIPGGVQTISTGAFQNSGLTEVVLEYGVITLANNSFSGCNLLKKVTFPASMETIGGFSNTGIKNILFAADAKPKEISAGAFENCDSLETVTLPNSIITIGERAFYGCDTLQSVTLPTAIKIIPKELFSQCKNLKSIDIPEGVTEIQETAFYECPIEEINLPTGLSEIGNSSLNRARIKNLKITEKITNIGYGAFQYAHIKETLEITPAENLQLGDYAFNCQGSYTDNGQYINFHLVDVHWNSTSQFPKNKFGQIDNLYLLEGGSVNDKNNIGYIFYNGITDSIAIAYNNNYKYTVNKTMKTRKVTYTKKFNQQSGYGEAAGWKTIVLPFNVSEITHTRGYGQDQETVKLAPFGSSALETVGTLPFWLYELSADGKYKAATEIKAHQAYLICMPNNDKYPSDSNISGDVMFAATDKANGITLVPTEGVLKRSKGTKFDLVPTYDGVMQHDTVYVLNENNWYYSDEKNYPAGSVFIKNYSENYSSYPAVYPFQAYLATNEGKTSVASAPMLYSIGGSDGTITGIEDIPFATPEKATKAYSRDGVLYINTNADRTINIYDVTGRTVRIIEAREGMNEVHGLDSGIYLLEGQKVVIGR